MNRLNFLCAAAGLGLFGGVATTANGQVTSEVPHPPMQAGEQAPQFYDAELGKWWACTASKGSSDRSHIIELLKWNIVQNGIECFPGTTVIVPFRVVTDAWFELDADGNALDPDYIPPMEDPMTMEEEDVCARADPNEILVESMAVEIDENFPVIVDAMEVIERLCGVTFVQRDPNNTDCFPLDDPMTPAVEPDQPWIRIQQSSDECPPRDDFDPTGNHSALGMVGMPVQVIVMEDWSVPVMVHELMHALGFMHEHQRFDRDSFVRVRQEHVIPDDISQFFLFPDPFSAFGPYDFESIMHYGRFAFSFNGQPTIDVLPEFENLGPEPGYETTIGTFQLPSPGDRAALEYLYGPSDVNTCDLADFNGNSNVDATDLLAFIIAWAAGDPSADFNLDGVVNTFDLLAYLGVFGNANNCDPTPPDLVHPQNNTVGRPG